MDKRSSAGVNVVYIILLVLALALFAGGIYLAVKERNWLVASVGAMSVITVLATWPIALSMDRSGCITDAGLNNMLSTLTERMEQYSVMLNLISEQQLLSDRAKGVAYREKDREALRRAIAEEVAKRDFESALLLTDKMETEFGYRQEAMVLRGQISEKQNESARKQILEAATQINRMCSMERWADANREAERLIRLFPAIEQVRNLPNEIETRRQQAKKQLLDAWHDATGRKDLDGAHEILKKLDSYLTPSEAMAMQEEARNVVKQRMERLRSQFAGAVHEQNWLEAYRVGEVIIQDYPNTQMAKEVKEYEDVLRTRATTPEPAQT